MGVTQAPPQPPGGPLYATGLQDKEQEADSRQTDRLVQNQGLVKKTKYIISTFLIPVNSLEK